MRTKLIAYLRGECSADDLAKEMKNHSDFVDLAVEKTAERRGLRPDQVRCSLMMQSISDPAISGAETQLTKECQGLH